MKKKPFNTNIFLVILLFIFIILSFVLHNHKYNKCVKINNEELKKCQHGDYGDYDCSMFENAEEICRYIR